MTAFPYPTPILGIVSEQDRACAEMLAVVTGKPDRLVWTYLQKQPDVHQWKPLDAPTLFTPLRHFMCRAWFTPTGMLALTCVSLLISKARYSNGRPRPWQGAQQETIHVHPDVVRYVHEVLAAEAEVKSEARRVKA